MKYHVYVIAFALGFMGAASSLAQIEDEAGPAAGGTSEAVKPNFEDRRRKDEQAPTLMDPGHSAAPTVPGETGADSIPSQAHRFGVPLTK